MTFAAHVLQFAQALNIGTTLPEGVVAMNPYRNEVAFQLCQQFYVKYYNDTATRTILFGINPGRFGGGLTGIPFTDPVKLEHVCGIANQLPKKAELSAAFIYSMISAYGGAQKFYNRFFISAVSPLGFIKDGKNLNYYDLKELQHAVEHFIVSSIQKQLTFNVNRKICYCLGEGDNFKFMSALNKKHNFFESIIPLPHPRFIMQYKRKHQCEYINLYLQKFNC